MVNAPVVAPVEVDPPVVEIIPPVVMNAPVLRFAGFGVAPLVVVPGVLAELGVAGGVAAPGLDAARCIAELPEIMGTGAGRGPSALFAPKTAVAIAAAATIFVRTAVDPAPATPPTTASSVPPAVRPAATVAAGATTAPMPQAPVPTPARPPAAPAPVRPLAAPALAATVPTALPPPAAVPLPAAAPLARTPPLPLAPAPAAAIPPLLSA